MTNTLSTGALTGIVGKLYRDKDVYKQRCKCIPEVFVKVKNLVELLVTGGIKGLLG